MSLLQLAWVAALTVAALDSARAQQSASVDFDANGPMTVSEANEDHTFDATDEPVSSWRPLFDLRVRSDQVNSLPAARPDLRRGRFRTRFGVVHEPGDTFHTGVAARASLGSDANRDNLRNNDNERSNHFGVDQAWLRWRASERTRLELGKAPLALTLTPLVWDDDLRPIGISGSHSREVSGFNRWQWDVGAFEIDHPLTEGPRLLATQFGWHWHEGAPIGFSAIAGYLAFDRLDPFARAGLGRGNPLQNARYVDDYRLLDLQLALRRNPGEHGRPLEARVDLLHNLTAEHSADAARFNLTWGDITQTRGWELGYAYQRIQATATLAAVNSDDWWFHAGARGHMLSAGYGISDRVSLHATGFSETRDGLGQRTDRLLLDVSAHW